MKKIFFVVFTLVVLLLNLNLFGLKRDYRNEYRSQGVGEPCIWHAGVYLEENMVRFDLMEKIPTTGYQCDHIDQTIDAAGKIEYIGCDNFAVYRGYYDHDYRRYNLHLTHQLKYYIQHQNCDCYWPENCHKAAEISDFAYILFRNLLTNTALINLVTDYEKQDKFTQSHFQTEFSLDTLTIYFIAKQFRFSDYYHVCKDIETYSKANYSTLEFIKIKNKLDNILEKLSSRFSKLYRRCLQLHFTTEIERELYFTSLFTKNAAELSTSVNFPYLRPLSDSNNELNLVENCNLHGIITDNTKTLIENGYAEPFSLQSAILLEKGTILNNQLQYKESISVLTQAIELNSLNREAYLERAMAYFETNQIELALQDYRKFKKLSIFPPFSTIKEISTENSHNNPDPKANPDLKSDWEYFKGFAVGGAEGSKVSLEEFIPSTLNTLRGIGNFLWVSLPNIDPLMGMAPEFSKVSLNCINACVDYYNSDSGQEIFRDMTDEIIPEYKELVSKWGNVSDYEKGKMAGFIIGKYGLGIFVCTKVVKIARRFQDFKRVNTALTLEACEVSVANKTKILEEAARRATIRQHIFKDGKIQIHWDKQNKHIPGSHNFLENRGPIKISKERLQELLEKYAGSGQPVGKALPGMGGYRERIDFGEIIGEYIYMEEGIIVKRGMTTRGIIHYNEKGFIHLIPSEPN